MKNLLYILLLILLGTKTQVQITGDNYPVQAHVFVSGAGSLKLSDYFTSSTKLGVDLILKDLTKSSLDVYLSWEIEGLGLGIQAGSSPGFVPGSFISLNRGSVRKLKGIDLRAYFQPGVVVAAGVSEAAIFSGSLPEGFYVLRVRAYEAGTGREVSNRAETYFSVAYALPPVLNQPLSGSEQTVTRPQNVLLQWTPRHTSTGSNLVTYQIKVCEVAEDDEPNVAILGSQTCFTVPQQTATTYLLKASDLPLKPGKRYAWQVQATDLNGALEFQNTGNSEVAWFRYGKACTAPEDLKATEIGPNRVNLSWKADPQAMGYKLYYKNQTAAEWQTQTTFGTSISLNGLDKKEPYSFKISTLCDIDNESPTSSEETWEAEEIDTELQKLIDAVLHPLDQTSSTSSTTLNSNNKVADTSSSDQTATKAATEPLPTSIADLIPTDPAKIPCASQVKGYENCSDSHDDVKVLGTVALPSLLVGDPLTIYDMLAIVTEVSGSNGTYSGKALVKLPFLNDGMMAVEFSNVSVVQDNPAIRGGCVTSVPSNGFFRARTGLSREELKAEEVALIDQIRKAQDPGSTYTTFGQQISQYDQTSKEIADATATGQSLSTEQKEALLVQTIALNSQMTNWLENANELIGGTTAGDAILAQIQALIDQLIANQAAMEAGTSFPSVSNIGSTVTGITDQIKALLNAPPTDTPRIQNLQATKITDKSATLSWQGDKRFTKYIVTVQKPGEGERIFEVENTKLTVENLTKSSNYNVKIVGYEGNQIVDEYQNGYFTTLSSNFPKPENLKISYLGEGKVKVTWDKNALHLKYKLKYTDKAGQTKYAYPSNSELELAGLASEDNFHLEIVAFSKTDEISDPSVTDFESPNICNRFKHLEISANNILQGESVTITAPNCDSEVSWYANNSLVYVAGQSHTFTPSESTTYKARCTIEDPNYTVGKASCEISETVEVDKKCENVNVTATPNQVVLGNPILLRANNCEGKIQWLDKFPNGTPIVEDSKSVLVYPEPSKQYFLSCKDAGGEICLIPAPQITVTCNMVLADNQLKQYHEKTLTYHDYIVKAAGCEAGTIKWTTTGGNSNLSTEEISPNTLRINKLRRFQDVEINASCILGGVTTCEVKHLIKGNLKNCEQFSEAGTITYLQDKILLKAPYLDKAIWDDIANSPLVREVSLPVTPKVYTATLNQTVSFKVQKKDYHSGGFLSTYRVKIDKGCQVSFAVEPKLKAPNNSLLPSLPCTPFVASANPQVLERGQATVFLAQGCQDDAGNKGTIKWTPSLPSNGVVEQTTTYSVTCDFAGQFLEQTLTLTVTEPVFKVSPSKSEILAGDPISLYASGCTSGYTGGQGTIKWSTGLTENAEKSKITVEPQKTITYTVSCDKAGKPTQTLYITVAVKEVGSYPVDPCDFVVATDIDLFNTSNPPSGNVKINIRGCTGGNLSWMTLSNNFENMASGGWKGTNTNTVVDANLPLTTTYRFRCQTTAGVCDKTITIPRTPRPNPVVISKDCRGYAANYAKEACISKVAVLASSNSGQSYNSKTNGLTLESTVGQNMLKLVDNECYNQGGISQWFYDAKRTSPLIPIGLYYQVPIPTRNTTYYSKCITNAPDCLSSLTVTICPDEVGTIMEDTFLAQTEDSETSNLNCGFISTQKAIGSVLKSMICDNGKLVMAEPINADKLEVLKNSILQQPIFDGLSLPTISEEMVLEIIADKNRCSVAIDDLVKDIIGTSLKGDFNDLTTESNLIDGAMACMEGFRTKPLWETDGHYSTVYLVALTLGIDENLARDLAKYTEQPDTYVHSEYDYELNETWIYPWQQAETHALTNGFHGVEEMITALKFLNTPNTDLQELGRLLHRYGDTYAHTEIPNTDDWSTVPDVDIYKHIDPWMKLINDGIITDGLKFLNDEDLQKKQLQGYTFAEYLNFIYLEHKSDKFRMYGDRIIQMIPFTKEHFSTPEKSQPDYIWVRPRWYYLYVKNLAKILSLKYNITRPFDATVFEQMLGYASKNKSKLKGIIDYEIAKKLNENYFIIPVFYAGDLFFANIDKLIFTDYLKEAKDAKDNALKYIQSISPNTKIEIIEIKGNMNLNSSCFYNTMAYKIYFK